MSARYGMVATTVLLRRELVRMVRQPSRVVATLGTVGLFWLVIGSGLSGSFVMPGDGGAGYASYLVPGMVTMGVLFGTVFASISLIQDRHSGFLQSALVSPAPRWACVVSKAGAGAIVGGVQSVLILLAGWMVGVESGLGGVLLASVAATVTALGVVSLGLALAWWVDSVSGFHGLMNLVLTPMWLLSGALFPAEGAAEWLGWVMRINPLHWCTIAMGDALGIGSRGSAEVAMAWIGTAAFAAASLGAAMVIAERCRARVAVSA